MFHATNFTESTQSQFSLEKLLRTSLVLWDKLPVFDLDPKTATADDISFVAGNMADAGLLERFDAVRTPDFAGMPQEQIASWMMTAVCTQWFGLWGDLAFPRIQMSHSFAAQLMATTISAKEIPNVEAPWPAFLIEVPEGLLPLTLANGTTTCITRVHVTSYFLPTHTSVRWWAFWLTGVGVEIIRVGVLEEAVLPRTKRQLENTELLRVQSVPLPSEPRDIPLEDDEDFWDGYSHEQEDRISTLLGRLVIGACVFMTERANYKEKVVRLDRSLAPYAARANKRPESRVFTVGKPVKIDFRLAIKAYLEGRRGPVTAQHLVAGHHKNQPCGPGGVDRKWIFVAPYWRGPEDGPILVRPHVGGET